MKKIAIITATRAEYGILTPLIRAVHEHPDCALQLYVTGTHLSEKHGYTIQQIREDHFPIFQTVPILEEGNTPCDITCTMANAARGFAECFRRERPDLAVLLGDRTEMLGIAAAALNERIPIAHIHGGEVTEGAVDESIRHALTKMSYLHFTSAEIYRQRVIQLGEEPRRVFNTGSLGTDNILHSELMTQEEIRREAGIPGQIPFAAVTFHPVTLEPDTAKAQTEELCKAMERNLSFYYLITGANADVGGDIVNAVLAEFADAHPERARLVASLGMKRYLSAVKYASFVLGNSSSGVIEAPVLGTPTVNVGDRQRGRVMADSVISCGPRANEISDAIQKAASMEHKPSLLFGDGNAAGRMMDVILRFLNEEPADLKKKFYDIPVTGV